MMLNIPILAIDAGASFSSAALCDLNGNIISYAKGGSCNYQNIGIKQTRDTFISILSALIQPLHKKIHVEKAVIGIAGLDTQKDNTIISEILRESFHKLGIDVKDIILKNDGYITLLGILGERAGILAVSGTGSVVWGKTEGAGIVRAGGWGHRIGDDGSGYFIGHEALRHIFRSIDGQDPPSAICKAVLETLQLPTTDELLSWIYSTSYSVEKIASLAPSIFKLAHARDPTAMAILQRAGQGLADTCMTVIQKCHLDNDHFEIIVAGSVLQKDIFVYDAMLNAIKEKYENFTVHQLESEPIYCALLHGLRSFGSCTNKAMIRCQMDLCEWESKIL
ncbi:BadF/BadG/BcrA/BcrD ATPase family protein [Scopulibacillus cellulosilyticus]|uniref:BadF/BadG/BcrA/BcrD ATPase family protein n=1 Tax=Scopulibacillus cellulosilyticus TaxID=2665665 RepID=A0ABW2PQI4_9BACL